MRRTRRPDADHDLVLHDRPDVFALPRRLRLDHAPQTGEDDPVLPRGGRARGGGGGTGGRLLLIQGDPVHVLDAEHLAHAR